MSRDRDRGRRQFAIVTDSPRMVRTMVDGVEDHRLVVWYDLIVWVAADQEWRIAASFERVENATACAASVNAAADAAIAEAVRAGVAAAHALGRLDALNELLEMMAVYKPRSSPELDEIVRSLVEDAQRKALEAAPDLNSNLARLRPDAAPLDASDVRSTES